MRRVLSLAVVAIAALTVVPAAAAWTWPADGPVLRPFSVAENEYAAGQHRGIDIGAAVRQRRPLARRRHRLVRRLDPGRRPRADDPDRRRLRGDAAPTRLGRPRARERGRRRRGRRNGRRERGPRDECAPRPPRHPGRGRAERVRRPDAAASCADASVRSRACACSRSCARVGAGVCARPGGRESGRAGRAGSQRRPRPRCRRRTRGRAGPRGRGATPLSGSRDGPGRQSRSTRSRGHGRPFARTRPTSPQPAGVPRLPTPHPSAPAAPRGSCVGAASFRCAGRPSGSARRAPARARPAARDPAPLLATRSGPPPSRDGASGSAGGEPLGLPLILLAGAAVAAGIAAQVARRAAPIIDGDELLSDDTHLLRQLDAAHRSRVHDHHRRHPRAPSPPARRAHLLPDGGRRARGQGRAGGEGARSDAAGVRRPDRRLLAGAPRPRQRVDRLLHQDDG